MNLSGLLILAIGLFSVAGGAFDWDWFMNSRRASIFVRLFKRGGARAFYILLGSGLAVLGVLIALNVIQ
jgi:hypothetical protein